MLLEAFVVSYWIVRQAALEWWCGVLVGWLRAVRRGVGMRLMGCAAQEEGRPEAERGYRRASLTQ